MAGRVFTGSFEMRKVIIKWGRSVGGGITEDAALCTIHFLKLSGGAPTSVWVTADYTTLESALDTFWGAIKASYGTMYVLQEYRWFKSGPAWEPKDAPNPVNPAERTTVRSVAATGAGSSMPPQVATTITEKTTIRKRWGRMYLPAPLASQADASGRVGSSGTFGLPAAVTLFNAARAASLLPVVWSRGRGAHVTSAGTSIPDHDAAAYEVDSLQADNVWDVVRSRRYENATVRTETALT